jgi:hypothetical protein
LDSKTPAPPHRLFQTIKSAYNDGGVIVYLPDHSHEGALRIPANFDSKRSGKPIWPSKNSVQPKPKTVAWGTNNNAPRPRELLNFESRAVGLVSAYDGHSIGIGNIVAHSTWHHFVNVNLVGFMNGEMPSPTLLHIRDYFINLAIYLDNPFQSRLRFKDIIWADVRQRRSPVLPFGIEISDKVDTKNPIINRCAYSYELGRQALDQIKKSVNPIHFGYCLLDEINMMLVEYDGVDVADVEIDTTMILGEILNSAQLVETQGGKLDIKNCIEMGLRQGLLNHIQRLERPLDPLKEIIMLIKTPSVC